MKAAPAQLAILILLFAAPSHGVFANENFMFSRFGLAAEFSQAAVNEVFQDSEGYLWILAQEGLYRFDGKESVVFRADVTNPNTLSGNGLTSVVEDGGGSLWFGTYQGGINRLDKRNYRFTAIRSGGDPTKSLLSDEVLTLYKGGEDELWVSYGREGFSLFHPGLGRFKHYTPAQYPLLDGHPVNDFVKVGEDKLLLATRGGGILELNLTSNTLSPHSVMRGEGSRLKSVSLLAVHLDGHGNIWLGTGGDGAFKLDSSGSLTHYPSAVNRVTGLEVELLEVHDFLEHTTGAFFLATDSGIARLDGASNRFLLESVRDQDSTPFRMLSIIEDRTGLLWVGSFSGVFTGFESSIGSYGLHTGLKDEAILSVSETKSGELLVGSTSGLEVLARDAQGAIVSSIFDESPVTSLLLDKDTIWLGTYLSGLIELDHAGAVLNRYHPSLPHPFNISDHQVTSVFLDRDDNLWVGTINGGLNVRRAGSESFVSFRFDANTPGAISSDVVYAIFQESSGDLWVGTDDGLNRYDAGSGTFEVYRHEESTPGTLSSSVVLSIYEDDRARLWVGTDGGGLNMWEPFDRKRSLNRFSYFQSNIQLNSSNVWAIQGDESGNVWLATSGGLTQFNFERNESRTFTVEDGLESNDFNFGASHRGESGHLYFGSNYGLITFDPSEMAGKAMPPKVVLTGVKLGNAPVWFDVPYSELDRIELDPDDYLLGLSFVAMDFRAPNRNQYRYQMVGLDQNWVDLGNRNYIDFSKLPMGQYVLRIQGANPDGVWSPEGIVLDVVVHPPFYFTWYAFIIYFMVTLLLVALFFYRQRQKAQEQLAYQMQLEEDVKARTLDLRRSNDKLQVAVEEMGRARQEAEQANQTKSEFLAALSHEIRTPMHGVLGMTDLLLHSGLNDQQQNFAESAHVSANELLGLIDNILDFSKIEAGKLELEETTFSLRDLLENLCYLYGELAQAKNLELNLVFNVDLRRQLYGDPVRLRQVLQNLLSNAIKFTKRGSVNLVVNEVLRKNKSVQVDFLVEDTGIGMNEETVERVFEAFSQADSSTTRQFGGTGLGLSIAKQLIDLMGGELDVKSRPGVGTAMSVALSFVESPIYTDPIHADGVEDFYAEVAAPVPETRAMFRSQLEALGMKVRECATVEELTPVAEHDRVVLVDVGCLYNSVGITLVENLSQDAHTRLLLVTPLSGQGVPPELEHLRRTTKPVRLGGLVSDIQAVGQAETAADVHDEAPLMRFEKRLLLVEDIPANQQIAKAMLESFGCSVAVARNGEVALEMFQQEDFDLVLMDCQMPVMDGFEATRHIRQYEMQRDGSRRTPVVALTAGKTESEKERCYASGMDRILFKPYSTYDLNGLLGNYFESSGQVERSSAAKAQPAAQTDILDLKALDNIRSIETQSGGGLLAAVIVNFRTDGEQKLDELREAVGDAKALGAGAHAIKSMSLNLGCKALSEYCRRCESRWKAGEIDEAEREVEVLAGHFSDAARALGELLAQDAATTD